ATWNLVAGEGNVYMNGFDSQLNALLPESTSMTVNGVWRQWNGPIGCGKESEVAQIWFLEVHEIISPNPLVQVTLTPTVIGGEGEEIADNGEPSSFSNPETTPSAEDELVTAPAPIQPEATSQLVGTPTPFTNSNPNPTGTATAVTTPRNEEDNDGSEDDEDDTNDAEPTTAPTSSTGGSNTPTPTATISSPSGNSTPTATPLSSLTTQTPTPEPYETVIGKVYPAQGADFQLLNSAETHIWELDILADDIITIHVAAQPSIDVVVSLIDPNGD
ncbi:MAG: hypothetical protein GY943_22405, partial [Chloroflexi bacterium]|nr:hypothetical protein [Chloroflexota bacterium]